MFIQFWSLSYQKDFTHAKSMKFPNSFHNRIKQFDISKKAI